MLTEHVDPPLMGNRIRSRNLRNLVRLLLALGRLRPLVDRGEDSLERIRRHERRELVLRVELHQQIGLPLAGLDIRPDEPPTASFDTERSEVEEILLRNLAVLAVDLLQSTEPLVTGHDNLLPDVADAGDRRDVVRAVGDLIRLERPRIAFH